MAQHRIRRFLMPLGPPRAWLLVLTHELVFVVAYWLAFVLRFSESRVPTESLAQYLPLFWDTVGWVVGLQLLVFWLLGQFHGWWRYVTFADLPGFAASLGRVAVAAGRR